MASFWDSTLPTAFSYFEHAVCTDKYITVILQDVLAAVLLYVDELTLRQYNSSYMFYKLTNNYSNLNA